jgi:hypothetical protein
MSETNTDAISALEQSDSQGADEEMNESACGTLDDIAIGDSLWVDINSHISFQHIMQKYSSLYLYCLNHYN